MRFLSAVVSCAEPLALLLSGNVHHRLELTLGDAVRQSKLRYFLESRRLDAYDKKSLMQWAYYGLPMMRLRTGIVNFTGQAAPFQGAPRALDDIPHEDIAFPTVRWALAQERQPGGPFSNPALAEPKAIE